MEKRVWGFQDMSMIYFRAVFFPIHILTKKGSFLFTIL